MVIFQNYGLILLFLRFLYQNGKAIKKTYKILFIFTLVVLSLPVAAFFLIQSSRVQTYLTQIAAEKLSERLNAEIHVGKVNVSLFNRVILEDVHIKDQMNDTLLKTGRISASIHYLNRREKRVLFNSVELDRASINLYTDTAGVQNAAFLVDALEGDRERDRDGKQWEVYINSVSLKDSRFTSKDLRAEEQQDGVSFSDLDISNLNINLSRFRSREDTLLFNISHLSLEEKSGFRLTDFSSINSLGEKHITSSSLLIETERSKLELDSLHFDFENISAFEDFLNQVEITAAIKPSNLFLRDLGYFITGLDDYSAEVAVDGTIRGFINNLKGDDVNIVFSDKTSVLSSFNLVGLPALKDTYIFMDLHNLTTTSEDLEAIISSGRPDERTLPDEFRELGEVTYTGKFTGFIDDFVAYGEMSTSLGRIFTDLSLRPDTSNTLIFNGEVRTSDFHAGKLAKVDNIGKITFSVSAKGFHSPATGLNAELFGMIDSLEVIGYNYRKIDLSGQLADRKFDGSASVEDENINLEFNGGMDFSGDPPVFDFSASISDARLYELNLSEADPEYTVSFMLAANFIGSNIDNMDGEIELTGAHFTKSYAKLDVDTLSLLAYEYNGKRKIELNSSFAHGELSGHYEFATLAGSFDRLLSHYLPSYSEARGGDDILTRNNFDFILELDNTSEITGFFFPHIHIGEGTRVEGRYDPGEYSVDLKGTSPEFSVRNYTIANFEVTSRPEDDRLVLGSIAETAAIGDNYKIENIRINSLAFDDSLRVEINWDNKEKLSYKGNIIAGARLEKIPGKVMPLINICIEPTDVIVADYPWHIGFCNMTIDSTSFSVDNFNISHKDQLLQIDGKISENPSDSLFLHFIEFDLENLELFNLISNMSLSGIVSGESSISDLYNNTAFHGDLSVNDLIFNDQDFGDLKMLTDWNSVMEYVYVNAESKRDDERILGLYGTYTPAGNGLDFSISLGNVNLKAFDRYEDEAFGNLEGFATGEVHVGGTTEKPLVNGNIFLDNATFTVDYTQCRYNFSHSANIVDNQIIFNEIEVFDERGNRCIASGRVTNDNFSDFRLDIRLQPERFMSLNTTQRDNDTFYGRVFASGIVNMTGPTDNIHFDISARTERNTRIFIPLDQTMYADEFQFVRFTSPKKDEQEYQEVREISYEVDLTGIRLDFGLDVTPDAETQIIFDSRIGDVIRGRGTGSLTMEIDEQGRFGIFGDYEFEQGDYLFTLQNVINKRFDIERGSTITWSGDPADANIDMTAVYRLRAPLNNLDSELGFRMTEGQTGRVPVVCQINLTNRLLNPNINFGITLPTVDSQTRQYVEALLNTEEKINRQFLSLLVINNFLPEQEYARPGGAGNNLGVTATGAGMTTVSEFLSSQLSSWMSQLSSDIDFGVNFRPGDEITPDEVELALSTQLFNERVTINGSVDVGGRQTSTSNIVGDVDVDIMLNRSGKLRMKVFTRSNDNLFRPNLAPYTQGVGIFYREEFDSFDELMKSYWRRIFPSDSNNNN